MLPPATPSCTVKQAALVLGELGCHYVAWTCVIRSFVHSFIRSFVHSCTHPLRVVHSFFAPTPVALAAADTAVVAVAAGAIAVSPTQLSA